MRQGESGLGAKGRLDLEADFWWNSLVKCFGSSVNPFDQAMKTQTQQVKRWMPGKGWIVREGAILIMRMAAVLAPITGAADDLTQVFQQGRALFFQGKFREAKPLLEQVAAANPRHTETQAMLARIRLQEKKGPTLADKLGTVVLPRVEFADVTVTEALEGLKGLSKAATDGKVVPNFIVRDGGQMTQRIDLRLQNVPLNDAIRYVAETSKTICRYEANAVVFSTQ